MPQVIIIIVHPLILGVLLGHAWCAAAVQVHDLGGERMVNLLGRLAARVGRTAGLALAAGRLQVVVLVGQRLHVGVAVAQRGHRRDAAREHADRVEGALEGKLVVGDLVRIAPAPARLDADQVPAAAPPLVRLRHSEVVLALVAAQLLRVLGVVARSHHQHECTQNEQQGQQAYSPGKSEHVNG